MCINIHSFKNSPIDSVSYLIWNENNGKSFIIDPGTENDTRITDFLKEKNLILEYIVLTHEHFDHILGVNFLRECFKNIQIISSGKTSDRLPNPKKNLSIFHNQTRLIVEKADIIIEEGSLDLIGKRFDFFSTPGHTDSSISIKYKNNFFSGDFLLIGERVVTNLPTGSKVQYQKTLEQYNTMLEGMTIFPGHGKPYIYNSKQ